MLVDASNNLIDRDSSFVLLTEAGESKLPLIFKRKIQSHLETSLR